MSETAPRAFRFAALRRFQRFPWMREQSACGSTLEDRQPKTSIAVESIFDATAPNVKN